MVSASEKGGLGHQLVYFSSLIRMDNFGAVLLIIEALGVSIYVVFYFIGKRWASWEALEDGAATGGIGEDRRWRNHRSALERRSVVAGS